MPKYIMVYTFCHEPSEVIIHVLGSTEAKARVHLASILDVNRITMPEGVWQLLGSMPFEENW